MASARRISEEDRDLLLSRSRDLKWVDDLSGFQCVRCDKVLIRHYIANCGHKFCLNCKKILGDGSKRWKCPFPECKKTIEDIHLQNFYFDDTVLELRAHCPNQLYGCPFVGQLRDIMIHLKTCKDTRESALPVLLDENEILDANYASKLNEKMDTMCGMFNERFENMSLTLSNIKEENKVERESQVKKWTEFERMNGAVSDLQRMSINMAANVNDENKKLREEMLELKRKCEQLFELLEFNEKKFNENEKQLKSEVERNKSQFLYEISMLNKKLNNEENKLTEEQKVYNSIIPPEVQHLRRVSEYRLEEKPDFTWTVRGVNSLLNGSRKELLSDVFLLKGYPFGGRAKLTLNSNGYVYLSLSFIDISKTNEPIETKCDPHIYVTLKNQSNSKHLKNISNFWYFSFYEEQLKLNTFYAIEIVQKSALHLPLYVVDDSMVVDVHVEAPEVAQLVHSYDGTLTWAIDNYTKMEQFATYALPLFHLSPYFYTSPSGYRVQAYTFLREHKGLFIEIHYLNGLYDGDQYQERFPHKTTVTVFDPTQHTGSISKSVERDFIGRPSLEDYVRIYVGTCAEIENLLYHDTMYYKITIEPLVK